jgi:hypothetical protein
MFYFDPLYFLLVGPAIILAMWAQIKVSSTFGRYSKVAASSGLSGAEVAREILDRNGLSEVKIESVQGKLTDHYDPRTKVLRLSQGVYNGRSLAALGVAAHEAGHAIQHATNYAPLALRSSLVPAAMFGSNLGPILIILGLFLLAGASAFSTLGGFLIQLGIIAFAAAVLFQLITLPVEYNASKRALNLLTSSGFITRAEYGSTQAVLNAAALTYLAAALAAIMQLIYFILLSQRRQ